MGFVARLMGNGRDAVDAPPVHAAADDALDTLGILLRSFGEHGFALDDGEDAAAFAAACNELARHVENGAAVPALGIERADGGARRWGELRRYFTDRRRAEQAFVTRRLADYRGIVDDLVQGLRELGQRHDTEDCVARSLKSIEAAVTTGDLPEIKATLNETVRNIAESFTRQKQEYERRIGELNQRMTSMRDDLVTAREEMKRDALTGAYNRGAFDTAIIHSLNLNFILNQPVTVMFIDLDYFKEINDGYGHAAGDDVLRAVGECLARCFIRKTDVVARFGGDEFAVILADTSANNATGLLDRLYAMFADIRVPYADDAVRVSCSTGYTELRPGDSVESLVKRVDGALYAAKEAGRSCYRYAEPPEADDALSIGL